MKSKFVLAAILVMAALSSSAQKDTKKFSVGLGLEAGIPTGNLATVYNVAAGLTLRLSYHVGPGFVTLTSGAIGYAPKSIEGVPKKLGLEIPVRAGYKYLFPKHFFVMGELGYANFKTYYGDNGNVASVSSGSFIAAPSAGLQFNAFEVGLRYGINFKSNGGLFALRIAVNF